MARRRTSATVVKAAETVGRTLGAATGRVEHAAARSKRAGKTVKKAVKRTLKTAERRTRATRKQLRKTTRTVRKAAKRAARTLRRR